MKTIEKITLESEYYPKILKNIDKPPHQLYIEGNIELLKTNAISIIGSRSCSEDGIIIAKRMAGELALQGLTIVSGMAKGIDTAAHIGALEAGGATVAVLGSGFKHIFPKENIGLFHKIIESGNAAITEYPPEINVNSKQFLERNRIVSGLSLGTLVVEAAFRSGTSVTASLAERQGRKVFCIPHEIENTHGAGTNRLLKNGAILVTESKDIIEQLPQIEYKKQIQTNKINQKMIPKEYLETYKIIEKKRIDINQICRILKKPINDINSLLFMMELEGYIIKLPSGEYKIKGE